MLTLKRRALSPKQLRILPKKYTRKMQQTRRTSPIIIHSTHLNLGNIRTNRHAIFSRLFVFYKLYGDMFAKPDWYTDPSYKHTTLPSLRRKHIQLN